MPRTESLCRTTRSERIASWAAKPWRVSSLFSSVSAFNRLPKRLTPTNAQSWDYDAVGNWDSVTTNSTTQTRGANRQNEITSVSGATTPTYDNNGNLTKDENDYRFVWDAWNREVKIKNSSNTVITTNAFDGLNRKVQVTTSSGTIDEFFSNNWQVLEGKSGSNTLNRYVWSPAYVDGLVTRDRDTDANGTLDERLFALQDANWNVTGITNTSGTIQERYTETPYGVVTFRDGSGSTISVSAKGWDILHQGAKADIIGDYDFRNRVYSPALGRWLSNDPLGFEAGDVNTFRYVGNGPGNGLDPWGLEKHIAIMSTKKENSIFDTVNTGHVAIAIIDTDAKTKTSYALWPDDHPDIIKRKLNNGPDPDVRKDFFRDQPGSDPNVIYNYRYCVQITEEQYKKFLEQTKKKDWTWSFTQNCASFGSDVFYDVTGIDIDADDWFDIETPSEVARNIRIANGGKNSNWNRTWNEYPWTKPDSNP